MTYSSDLVPWVLTSLRMPAIEAIGLENPLENRLTAIPAKC